MRYSLVFQGLPPGPASLGSAGFSAKEGEQKMSATHTLRRKQTPCGTMGGFEDQIKVRDWK